MRFRITSAVASVGLAAVGSAQAAVWDGGGSDAKWSTTQNWNPDGAGPTSGNISIDAANLTGAQTTADYDYAVGSNTFGTIDIVAGASTSMALKKSGARTMNTGLVSVISEQGASADQDATLWVTAANFAPSSLAFNGGENASDGFAVGDFDASFSVSGDVSILQGYSEFYPSTGITATVGDDLLLDSGGADLEIIGSTSTGKIDVVDDVLLDAEAGGAAVVLTLTSGELEANDFSIKSRQSAAGNATLTAASGAILDPQATMSFDGAASSSNGHAVANINANVTVGTSTAVEGYVDFNVGSNAVFSVGALTLNNSGTSLTITGSEDSDSVAEVIIGTFTPNSQPLTLTGPILVQ